jgi:hypothetical protein
MPTGFLPRKEAAAWAGVSDRTMKRWIVQGLPVYQAGPRTKVLISPKDIEQFLTRKQTQPVDLKALVDGVLASLTR